MKSRLIAFGVACLLLLQQSAKAEDIDLFLGTPPGTTEVPNVLIILDNTANWTTPFTNEQAALAAVFNALPVDKFRVGLMFFTETGSPNNNIDGGYVRAAIRLMDATNKPLYANLINGLDVGDDKSNGGKAGLTMAEAYYYFNGSAPRSGNHKVKTDYTGNVTAGAYLANSRAVWALPNNALPSVNGSPYTSPVVTGCAKNFIIYISNGAVQDNNSDTSTATTLLSAAGGNTTAIPISPSGSQDNVADEWARFMKTSSHGITTYTVDVNKVTTGQGPGWTALLKSMAGVSGGKYFNVSSAAGAGAEISAALNTIFTEILSVNSVFASASLPTTANTQNTFLNQVFIGMFRPDADAYPRWPGNLKQYKMGVLDNSLELLDADDALATNNNTGFIAECARSFWTPSATDTYWSFKPQGDCLAVTNASISNSPDGNVVEKGAHAYKLRDTANATSRTVKTCSPTFSSCTALTDFATSNAAITQALLNNGGTDRTELINWAKGRDTSDEDVDGVTTAEMRPSVHGDVIHSRPVVINYGDDASPQVVVFYGGNDGVLRAINGNRSASIGSVTAGSEIWSFLAPEFYSSIKRLRDNTTQISFPGSAAGALPKPYGFDAPVAAFEGTISGIDKKFIYAPMRRGGRALYAFDVTNIAAPTLKWKKGCPNATDDTDCTTGFTGIGQTWANPGIIYADGYGSGNSPMLIMGGGYDTCEDTDTGTANNSCTSTKGNKIYVMDADTGGLLKTFDTDRSVIADIKISSINGKAQYGYAADLGGNLYRITMLTNTPANWTITKIASLGCDTTSPCDSNRKFMFGPSVVKESTTGTYYLLLGSGDREKPITSYTATTAVTNYFFMVKDQPENNTWLSSENANCGSDILCLDSLLPITASDPDPTDLAAKKGWYLALAPTEQVINAALTLSNNTYFATHQPAVAEAGSCGNNLGTALSYAVNFRNASTPFNQDGSRYGEITGGGLSPSAVAGTVILDDGSESTFCFGCGGKNDTYVAPSGGDGGDGDGNNDYLNPGNPAEYADWIQPRSRVYWYIEQ